MTGAPRVILGIDPGISITGFGVVRIDAGRRASYVTSGCIRTRPEQSMSSRLLAIYADCLELIRRYEPQEAAVEKLFVRANLQNALTVGQVRGVIMLALAQSAIPVGEYTSMEVRGSVLGYGKADKGQVQHMVARLLALATVPRPDDAADALAVALCHGLRPETSRLRP
ncbi:MAG: crossover junction endodeoxyribonuclease RuvC [Candidatus Wallbacteria bacterium]|nr:crossover junction endodeoxyribonuclease RuvC [Candidatus Wallbacteria bacterium]